MIRLLINSDNVNHRGTTVNKGDIIEEEDKNHIGALQSVGATIYKGELPEKKKEPEAPAPEPEPKPEPAPETPKKKTAPKRKKSK
jgi:outer membrane biosynthesis protein TonB